MRADHGSVLSLTALIVAVTWQDLCISRIKIQRFVNRLKSVAEIFVLTVINWYDSEGKD